MSDQWASSAAAPACGSTQSFWKAVLVVKASASFNPVAWLDAKSFEGSAAEDYVKGQLIPGVAVPIALLGIVLLYFLLFATWRLFKCCRCCKRTEPHGVASKRLRDPWLCAQQVLVGVCGAATIALAIYGMVTLPKNPLGRLSQQADVTIDYGSGVLSQANATLKSVQAINDSLSSVQRVIDTDIDAPAISTQLQSLKPFVLSIQNMSTAQTALDSLRASLVTQLTPALSGLLTLVNNATTFLIPSVQELAALPDELKAMKAAVQQYVNELGNLPQEFNSAGMFTVGLVKSAQDGVQLDSWRRSTQVAQEALTEVQQAQTSGLLPAISTGCTKLASVQASLVQPAQTLVSSLQSLADLSPESLSQILPDLLSRLQHINQSVVMLDASTLRSYALAQQAWAAVSSLYPSDAKTDMQSTNAAAPGAVSKDTLLDWVNRAQEIVRRLQDTEQVTSLSRAVVEPSQRLAAAPNSTALSQALTDVITYIQVSKPLTDALAQTLATHMKENTQDSYTALVTQAQIVINASQPLVRAMDGITTSDSWSYVLTASNINNSVPVLTQQASEARAALQQALDESQGFTGGAQAGQLSRMMDAVNQVVGMLPDSRTQILDAPIELLNKTVSDAQDGLDSVRTQVQDAVDKVSVHINKLSNDVLPTVQDTKSDIVDTFDYYWRRVYIGLMVGYGVVIFFVLILGLFTACQFPFGIVLLSVLLLVGAAVWLVVALVTMGAMVVLQDGCAGAERIILHQLSSSPTAMPIGLFYLSGTPGAGGVRQVLASADIVDIDKVQSSITDSQNELLNRLQADWQVQPGLSAALMDVTRAVEVAQTQINTVVSLLEYAPVHGLYMGLKSEACCMLGSQLFVAWICITGSGLFAFLAVVFVKFVLGSLDTLPHEGCCGCHCYRASDYEAFGSDPSQPRRKRWSDSWGGARWSLGGGFRPPFTHHNHHQPHPHEDPSALFSLHGVSVAPSHVVVGRDSGLGPWVSVGSPVAAHSGLVAMQDKLLQDGGESQEIELTTVHVGVPALLDEVPSAPPLAIDNALHPDRATDGGASTDGQGNPLHLFSWPVPRVVKVSKPNTPRNGAEGLDDTSPVAALPPRDDSVSSGTLSAAGAADGGNLPGLAPQSAQATPRGDHQGPDASSVDTGEAQAGGGDVGGVRRTEDDVAQPGPAVAVGAANVNGGSPPVRSVTARITVLDAVTYEDRQTRPTTE